MSSRQAFIWPYDDRARLAGEHLYEDKTSLAIEEVEPADAITPGARARDPSRAAREARGRARRPLLGAGERMSTIALEPVDRVEITVLMDNVTDPLLVDQDAVRAGELAEGLARRAAPGRQRA